MHTVKGIYDGKKVQLLEEAPVHEPCDVIVTFVEEEKKANHKISDLRGKLKGLTNEQIDEQSKKLREEWQKDI